MNQLFNCCFHLNRVFIKNLSDISNDIKLNVSLYKTAIIDIKKIVDYFPQNYDLFYKGLILKDSEKIEKYEIENNSILYYL